MPQKRRLRKAGWAATSAPFVALGYSVFKALYDFTVHHVDVAIPTLPRALDGLRIAQLSDLHAGSLLSPEPFGEAVALANSLRPDLIAVTGDFVNYEAAELYPILPALAKLEAPLGVYGCLGNHDHYADVKQVAALVRSTGLDLLVNQHVTLPIDGADLHIIGTDNTGYKQEFGDLRKAQRGIQRHAGGESCKVLLAHDPTFWDRAVLGRRPDIPLMLCGHTHGGQIGREGANVQWSLSRFAYRRWAGLYTEHIGGHPPQHLYVNRGLGTMGPPVRIGIRPEITLLTLRRDVPRDVAEA